MNIHQSIGWLGLSLGPPRPREPFLLLFTSLNNLNLNHLSASHSHVTSSCLSLGLRVYSSPLFFNPVSLLMVMAYPHKWSSLFVFCFCLHWPTFPFTQSTHEICKPDLSCEICTPKPDLSCLTCLVFFLPQPTWLVVSSPLQTSYRTAFIFTPQCTP